MASQDPTTQSNYFEIYSEHIVLDWTVDFTTKVIEGSATHTLNVVKTDVRKVIFDVLDLDLKEVKVGDSSVKFDLGDRHPVMGSALTVPLPADLKSGSKCEVKIVYSTTEGSTALQWLTKEQTQGKSFPYLFSQCQPIYARSLLPVQDTPSVKITYSATATAILPVLLSAIRVSPPSDGPPHAGKIIGKDLVTYSYNQPVPIPSYLIAIASGDLRYRAFEKVEDKSWNSGVWTEPSLLDAAFLEFSQDTTKFLVAEENIVGGYRFGTYDLLVLPYSFPYGGMENACLSFLNPTLLTGDRSLVDVVVHEATHSWFGNGVTHVHASHFWLNEGWTTYMERVLQQILHGPAERGFAFVIGNKALEDDLQRYVNKPKYQRLLIDFEPGEDPDEAYSSVPYEKGANLLYHLEQTIGGLEVFLPYVKDYVTTFMGKSITTGQWKDHLYGYYEVHGGQKKIDALNSIDWNAWFYGEGVELPVKLQFDDSLAKEAYDLAARWDRTRSVAVAELNFQATDLDNFGSNQKMVLLELLQSYLPLPSDHISHLGEIYKFSTSSNAEIRFRFYCFALLDPSSLIAKELAPQAVRWVTGDDGTGVVKGRLKFCRPVFRAINSVDRELAVTYFQKFEGAYHPIARKLIEKDLGLV